MILGVYIDIYYLRMIILTILLFIVYFCNLETFGSFRDFWIWIFWYLNMEWVKNILVVRWIEVLTREWTQDKHETMTDARDISGFSPLNSWCCWSFKDGMSKGTGTGRRGQRSRKMTLGLCKHLMIEEFQKLGWD